MLSQEEIQKNREEAQLRIQQRERDAGSFPQDPGGGENICISCEMFVILILPFLF